ncbi:MAG TPA: hypothetical protein DCS87_17205 [Rheinheimera sp.]|nr:hypothetical protein [Rheinheimera sp.]
MKLMKVGLLLSCLVLLTSCVNNLKKLTVDEDRQLRDNIGYLLLSVETTSDLQMISINGPIMLSISQQDLKTGTNYLLVDVPEGEYDFTQVMYGYGNGATLKDGAWRFRVVAGKINYIGNLTVNRPASYWWIPASEAKRPQLILENRAADALEFMHKNYPNILKARALQYGGAGDDYFFPYAQKLPNGAKP